MEKDSNRSIDVDKEDVVHIWWWLVDSLFPKGDPDREQYMSQVCVSHSYFRHVFEAN